MLRTCSRCHSTIYISYFQLNRKKEYYKTCNSCRKVSMKSNKMLAFVKEHKYPEYKEVDKLIRSDITIWSEYGEVSHQFASIIWDNILDENIVKSMGQKINNRGGWTALSATHTVICKVARDILINKTEYNDYDETCIFSNIYKTIEHTWDGIGDWKA